MNMVTRTNIVLDDQLIGKAMRKAGVGSKREAVEVALKYYLRGPDYAGLVALYGSGGVAAGYDPKAATPARAGRARK